MPNSRVQVAVRTRPTSNFARNELLIDSKARTIKGEQRFRRSAAPARNVR